jgi:hypothetical protein
MTSQANTHDADEARRILLRTRDELSLTHKQQAQKARTQAADQLLAQVVALLTELGFTVTKDDRYDHQTARLQHTGSVSIRSNGGNIEARGIQENTDRLFDWHAAELEFDPTTGKLEGSKDDTRFVQVPGERIRKRNALAVVAELVDKCMRESVKT